jgi:hypothetical protein
MAILLRNLLDRHIDAILLEDAGLLGERERREAGPPGNADGDFGVLRGSQPLAEGNDTTVRAKGMRMGLLEC